MYLPAAWIEICSSRMEIDLMTERLQATVHNLRIFYILNWFEAKSIVDCMTDRRVGTIYLEALIWYANMGDFVNVEWIMTQLIEQTQLSALSQVPEYWDVTFHVEQITRFLYSTYSECGVESSLVLVSIYIPSSSQLAVSSVLPFRHQYQYDVHQYSQYSQNL